ncbi:PREDICTED: odorant receptor 4-like isoform X2 [Vollenhovia emeryi]|uniref:odorant receptor 4-like isoform X2 n=1 Tax=Vollenhovia emeryi TaxID=411798 RepID=UPI0005F4C27C|nr:PREDICTED: odorant receptor 4-like isoform X2 [Vollenhovia emeryi]
MTPPTPLFSPSMSRKSEHDEARRREDATSLEYYIADMLRVLEYACIWSGESSLSLLKTLLSTGATIVFMFINTLLLLSEVVALTMNNDLKLFANIIGVIGYRIYRNEMEHVRKYSNFFVWWWTFACVYGVLHWCANPLLLEWAPDQINSINHTFKNRILPFVGWYPLNTDNVYNYACLYLMQIIGGISPALGIVCYDAFYVTVLMVICAQFQYINTIMVKIDFDNGSETMFILESKLKACVDCHTEIIKFLKMLQTFSSPTMFAQCIETLVILCLVSFEASVIKIALDMESILKLWALLEYFLCAAFQLYFFCFFATRLEHLGLQIAHSVYSCGWEFVDFEKKAQVDFRKQSKHCDIGRLVQTIMVRAQRSIVLTGGPFYVLSLETFRVIMSMAMSNSVMLRTISELDE